MGRGGELVQLFGYNKRYLTDLQILFGDTSTDQFSNKYLRGFFRQR